MRRLRAPLSARLSAWRRRGRLGARRRGRGGRALLAPPAAARRRIAAGGRLFSRRRRRLRRRRRHRRRLVVAPENSSQETQSQPLHASLSALSDQPCAGVNAMTGISRPAFRWYPSKCENSPHIFPNIASRSSPSNSTASYSAVARRPRSTTARGFARRFLHQVRIRSRPARRRDHHQPLPIRQIQQQYTPRPTAPPTRRRQPQRRRTHPAPPKQRKLRILNSRHRPHQPVVHRPAPLTCPIYPTHNQSPKHPRNTATSKRHKRVNRAKPSCCRRCIAYSMTPLTRERRNA